MKKVRKRRFGRTNSALSSSKSTHIIKIGWKSLKQTRNGMKELPFKLNGFLICRDTLDGDDNNRYLIDYASMQKLGYSKKMIESALADGFKAPRELLPQQLRFLIMSCAKKTDEGFDFDLVHKEQYQLFGQCGLMCHGDGVNASRRQKDGTWKIIPCIPYGAEGADPETYCEFSGPGGDCKLHYDLSICLMVESASGGLSPLSPELGMTARYKLESTSELDSIQINNEIEEAAERVNGYLSGISGRLIFKKKRRRKSEGAAVVGSVMFSIDPESIFSRERELRRQETAQLDERIRAKREGIEYVPSSVALIEGPPVIDVAPIASGEPITHAAAEPIATVDAEPAQAQDAEPVQSPEPEPINEPDDDIDILVRALDEWAELTALENDEEWPLPIRRLMVQVDERTQSVAASVLGVEWFKGDRVSAQKRAGRHDLLRAMCETLMNSNDKNFRLDEGKGEAE